jgi:hypothetical protein
MPPRPKKPAPAPAATDPAQEPSQPPVNVVAPAHNEVSVTANPESPAAPAAPAEDVVGPVEPDPPAPAPPEPAPEPAPEPDPAPETPEDSAPEATPAHALTAEDGTRECPVCGSALYPSVAYQLIGPYIIDIELNGRPTSRGMCSACSSVLPE